MRIQDLCYRYADQQELALDHVSLDVERGEFVVLAGPSGCGKTTLALAIGGYLSHQFKGELSGSVLVDGVDTLTEPLFRAADVVGLVQQNPEDQFCTLYVNDEVAFGPENRQVEPGAIRELVGASLGRASALYLEGRVLDTLSGGEKQRVALASMLAGEPQVLILDEPTASLDPEATRSVLGVLDALRKERGLTLVVIEHKLAMLERFHPRVVRMSHGRIVQDHAAILARIPEGREPCSGESVAVELEHAVVSLGDSYVLHDVSMSLAYGQLCAVMGANGSGKTTLLRVMRGLQPVKSGQVSVCGRDVVQGRASLLADSVGFMFQNPDHQLLGDTVFSDVVYGLDPRQVDENMDYIELLLEQAGLGDMRERHPFALSYGQKRRLNLVSIFAHHPSVLLADEPLVGQDPQNARYVMGVLREAADAGVCVVASIHAPEMVLDYADRVVFLKGSRVVFDDSPVAVFQALIAAGDGVFAGVL